MATPDYSGTELHHFAQARQWKSYCASRIRPHIRGDVLEVGAGLGTNTALLRGATPGRWVCLEPDASLAQQTLQRFSGEEIPVEVRRGTSDNLESADCFDTIVYIDVLEHIEEDQKELHRVVTHLNPGGTLIILGPAHPFLHSPFDEAVGHVRRYTRRALLHVVPAALECTLLHYLDCAGVIASLANRLVLRQRTPSLRLVLLWDRVLVPVSRAVDPLLGHRVGKSVLGVWRKSL